MQEGALYKSKNVFKSLNLSLTNNYVITTSERRSKNA